MNPRSITLLATLAIMVASSPVLAAKPTTTASGWSAGTTLTSSGQPDPTRGDPQQNSVAVNASGLAVAVWDHYEYTPYPYGAEWVEASVQLPGGKWSAPVKLSSSTAWYAYHPRVAVGGDGTAVAIWIADARADTLPQNREIQVAVRPAGSGAWLAPVTLDTGLVGPVLPTLDIPQVAVDAKGRVIATWVTWDGTNMAVKAARHDPTWSAWMTVTLSPSGRDGLLPSVAMNETGDAIIAWGLAGWPRSYTTCTLQVAKWPANEGAPSAATTLPSQQQGCVNYYSAPQVAIGGTGLGTVAWVFTNMYSLSETSPGVWQTTPVEVVRPGAGQYLSNPSLAADAAGNLTIGYSIWDPNVGVDRGSAYAVTRSGGGWSTPYRFTYTTSQDAQFVRAATSPDGTLTFVGWVDNYNQVLQVSRRSSTGAWLKPQTVGKSVNMGFAQYFSIRAANSGNARVAWKTQSGQAQMASQFRP